MIIYLTVGDQPSGVFNSQVIDFVNFLSASTSQKVKLVAFLSIRGFFSNRRGIRKKCPNALVLPMLPRIKNWEKNKYLFHTCLILFRLKPSLIMGRNVLATLIALDAKQKGLTNKVLFDGRGAISAEWNEYRVVEDRYLEKNILQWEQIAVLKTDWRIAVSKKLVEFWEKSFHYKPGHETVIPCTLDQSYEKVEISEAQMLAAKERAGLAPDKITLVYSGSTAGWQSSSLLQVLLEQQLENQTDLQVLFLSEETVTIQFLAAKYPGRIKSRLLPPNQVANYLCGCDYGLLVREQTNTNRVAAPVKFAEYLACGLKVLISPNLGDYSELVQRESLGYLSTALPAQLEKISLLDKTRIQQFALQHFIKQNYLPDYLEIINQTT
ncbi:hypothetical protein GCM10027036_39070 [Flavihumibacter cheonanensis]|uniref:hypothetical protein n=1 Tax=Flavihumibacter cheonanensis TaxID=1442385 RepID=UPI001EF91141|nr:hypothetical protein [Flavihumibacter cheonanensis]MCG7753910.1 hypothetical protein [Flavihumibacter cheonanensis]